MGCGASKDSLKRVVPTDERSTNPAAAKSSNTPSAYSSTITPELDIIKILTESDLDPLKLKEKKDGEDEAAGTADSAWKLAISFKIICLPNQLIQAIKIIAELMDTSGITNYRPLVRAIIDSKEYFELSIATSEVKDIIESEFKYSKRLSEYFGEYQRDLEGWYDSTEKYKAYSKIEAGLADAASFQCESMGKKCVESRVKFLKHIYSRKSIFLQTAKLRVAKLTDLVKFFMSAESLVTHFEKKRLLLTTSTVADEKPVPNLAFFESLRAPLIRYSSSMKLYAALRPIYLCTELSTARHLLELITATGYHWPAAEFDTSVKNSIVKFQFTARRVRQKPKENNRNINTVDTVAVSSTDAATHHSSTSSNNNNSVLPSHLPSSPVNRIQTLRRQGQNYTTGSAAELRLNASNSGLAADLRQHQTATTTQLHTALSLTELPRLRGTLPIGSLSDLRTRNNGMIGSSPDKTSSLQQSDANISPNPGTTRNINASEGQLNRPTSSSIPNLHHRRSGSASTNLVNEQDQQRPPVNILAGSLTNLIGRGVSVIPPILNSSTPSSPTNATQSSEVPTAVVPVLPAPAASSQPGPQRTATTSNANQKLYPSSSYCKNIEDFQVFMKSIVADLKSKNDNFNKIEESWSQTVHSLLNGMDAEIAEVANQLQLGSEGVDESAKLSAIQDFIKFKFEASMLDLFPRKFLDASTAIVPLLKTCIETLVRHLGRLDKSYEAPIYPSMDVYNQKNAIKNWAGYKNEISNAKQIAARTQTQTGIRQAFTSTVAVGPSDSPPDYV